MHPALETLIDAAVLAPSGDNTQPWRFLVDDDEMIVEIQVDPTRDRSPMNANQRMARIACGAAAENMLVAAAENHWQAELTFSRDGEPGPQIQIRPSGGLSAGTIPNSIARRVTNRQRYDGNPLRADQIESLRRKECAFDLSVHWYFERQEIEALARLIGDADAVMFGIAEMRRAFLGQVRFDQPVNSPAAEGLPIGTVAHTLSDRIGLRTLRRLPQWAFLAGGLRTAFRRRAAELTGSASGLCVVTAPDDSAETDFAVGRVFERVWLTLTELGLAVQPMMSLPVLDGWARVEGNAGYGLNNLLRQASKVISANDHARIAAIFRFGNAAPPRCRTGRRTPPVHYRARSAGVCPPKGCQSASDRWVELTRSER